MSLVAGCGGPESEVGVRQASVSATPAFVQANSATPQTSQTGMSIPFTGAQAAGDLNVVMIGWGASTGAVNTVGDSAGNSYLLAVGPNVANGAATQYIYYARNIVAAAAGANAVSISFAAAVPFPDVRILEYSGIDPVNALDVAVGANGTNNTANSGSVTTTNATDLLVAGNDVATSTRLPGTGFTQRLLTVPDGDIAEDRVVTATGSYSATAGLSAAGGWVMQMAAFRAATISGDTTPPTAPSGLTATAASISQVNLAWTAATDNVGVTGYLVERCQGAGCSNFAQIGTTTTATTFNSTGLAPATSYSYRVRATDAANNLGPYSNVASTTTLADTTPPTAPGSLTATAPSGTQVNLAWTAATDNVGVTSYLVERCQGTGCSNFAQIGTATTTTFGDTGLTPGGSYSYRVRATDAAGNMGAYSNTASATTPAPDTTPPTAPSGLTATAASSVQVNLAWTAATDNVGVTSTLVERCQGASCSNFAQIGTSATTTFASTGLTGGITYSFRVRATDAAGNLGPYSNTATATTPNTPVTPALAQSNFTCPQSTSQATVTVTMTGAQVAGNTNVVIAGWNDSTAQVASVTDTRGNVYTRAAGPTIRNGGPAQSIYYASNIAAAAAGANTVTVTFTVGAFFPDIRVLEYSGIDSVTPVDVAVGATGTSNNSDSGPVLTRNPNDLLVAGNTVFSRTTGPGPGFTQRILTMPDTDFAEDRLVTAVGSYNATAPLSPSDGWVMQMVAFRAAGSPMEPPADTTPPVVTVTAPPAGATVSGTVSVAVTATDTGGSGVTSVQLVVDGVPVGVPQTNPPFSFSLDTTMFINGAHALSASALDQAQNLGTAPPVSVTFSNANDPSVLGLWNGIISFPIVSVHSHLLPNGSVLMNDGQSHGREFHVWNPSTGNFTTPSSPSYNPFCGGHDQMADGRIFWIGGHPGMAHVGITNVSAYNPADGSWATLADMTHQRWYPTVTMLGDGRFLAMSGEVNCAECFEPVPEIYNPATNVWTPLTDAPFTFAYYPHVYVLPDGRVIVAADTEAPIVSQILDVNAHTWTAIGGPAVDGGASATYAPGKFLKVGSSIDPDDPLHSGVATAYVLDTTQPSPTWRQVASMQFGRIYHNMTLLADGSALVTGGGSTSAPSDTTTAIMPAELWSPTTEQWTTVASMHAPRLYHSEALLLLDGRVLSLGGGRFDDVTIPSDQFNGEIYSPPYLFKGPRPVISSAPSTLQYGQAFTVQTPDAARIAKVAMVRFSSVTHSANMGQRYVPLSFTAGSGSLSVTAPANSNVAPGGNYMLFILDTNGVPSIASVVHF
jgi:chitodextrinase